MFVVCRVGSGLSDGLITRTEEPYRVCVLCVWCGVFVVWVCVWCVCVCGVVCVWCGCVCGVWCVCVMCEIDLET